MKRKKNILEKFGYKMYNFGDGYFHYDNEELYFVVNFKTKCVAKFRKEDNEALAFSFEDIKLLQEFLKPVSFLYRMFKK